MTTFAEMTVGQLLDDLASSNPTPGGGTASAVAGAMGAALLIMVTGLAKSRTNTSEEKAALGTARTALEPMRAELLRLAEADAGAFAEVMAAYRLPKATDQDRAARTAAVQQALQKATVTPLDTLRVCADALAHAVVTAGAGNRSAASDVRVAVELLEAAAAGAEANVRINLEGLSDAAFSAATSAETIRLSGAAAARGAAARQQLSAEPPGLA